MAGSILYAIAFVGALNFGEQEGKILTLLSNGSSNMALNFGTKI